MGEVEVVVEVVVESEAVTVTVTGGSLVLYPRY